MSEPTLDAEARARIRAEELERAKVREEIAAEQRIKNRPAYWTGIVLNALLTGSGLMYLGRFAAGLGWLVGTVLIAFLVHPLAGWLIGFLGSFWQYDTVYGQLYATAKEKEEDARQGEITKRLLILIGALLFIFFLFATAQT